MAKNERTLLYASPLRPVGDEKHRLKGPSESDESLPLIGDCDRGCEIDPRLTHHSAVEFDDKIRVTPAAGGGVDRQL